MLKLLNNYIKYVYVLVVLLCTQYQSFAQHKSDFQLLSEAKFDSTKYFDQKIKFGINNNGKKTQYLNPIYLTMSSLMFVYQRFISPQFSATCLFSPSCSAYSKNLIHEYGLVKGVIFTTERLSRCSRIAFANPTPDLGRIHEHVDYYRINENKYNKK